MADNKQSKFISFPIYTQETLLVYTYRTVLDLAQFMVS